MAYENDREALQIEKETHKKRDNIANAIYRFLPVTWEGAWNAAGLALALAGIAALTESVHF